MDVYFKQRMLWFNKSFGSYELVQGDFLKPDFTDKILQADIIFVNNFAFGTKVWAGFPPPST